MLTLWLNRLLLAVALVAMPLQGMATALSVLLCHGEKQMHIVHEQGNDSGASDHDHHAGNQQDDGGASSNSAYHPCCHYTAAAPAPLTPQAMSIDFPIRTYSLDTLHDLFIPDRPQRPPLA